MNKRVRVVVMNVAYLPVINPDIVTGYSLMILFIFIRMNLGIPTMLIAHIVFNIPFAIISIMPKLKQLGIKIYMLSISGN